MCRGRRAARRAARLSRRLERAARAPGLCCTNEQSHGDASPAAASQNGPAWAARAPCMRCTATCLHTERATSSGRPRAAARALRGPHSPPTMLGRAELVPLGCQNLPFSSPHRLVRRPHLGLLRQAEAAHMAVGSHELQAPALQGLAQAHRAAARVKSLFRRNVAKGPNPLAVKKKKRKQEPGAAAAAAEAAGSPAQPKRKRARRRRDEAAPGAPAAGADA